MGGLILMGGGKVFCMGMVELGVPRSGREMGRGR